MHPKDIRGHEYPPLSAVYGHNGASRSSYSSQPFDSWADAIEASGYPRPTHGQKVLPYGQGASHMQRVFTVFAKEEDNKWTSHDVEAATPDLAIKKVAFQEGEYFATLKKTLNVKTVVPVKAFDLLPSTPGGSD
jgi:hypothetical protein